jgi:hypothetical protein
MTRWSAEDITLMLKLIDQGVTHSTIAQRLGRSLNAVESQLFKLRHPEKYADKLAKARRPREISRPSATVLHYLEQASHMKRATEITLARSAGEFASARIKGLSHDTGRSAARV